MTDKDFNCVKCGVNKQEYFKTWYCDDKLDQCRGIDGRDKVKDDHIHLKCKRCGYEWIIPTKDSKKKS